MTFVWPEPGPRTSFPARGAAHSHHVFGTAGLVGVFQSQSGRIADAGRKLASHVIGAHNLSAFRRPAKTRPVNTSVNVTPVGSVAARLNFFFDTANFFVSDSL